MYNILIALFNHDYLPTNRLLVANLSLVFMSYKHDTPIITVTIRKMATKSPDRTEGVMLRNKLLGVVVVV